MTNLTFGQRAVGITFNPSSDPDVTKIKSLCAELIDFCNDKRSEARGEKARFYSIAITELQAAQMWAVKGATWKEDE